mmetsp:Transcript_7917/g.16944  ORF Transcript_7917/g.16944 Transcript_7917/m.16944 type:complete len:114 (-) Transcript_7917:244-585(-)|eukprot:CAMPEP_0171342876 /NCGR_PEP_ID=MMETSP0878-20121228/15626_1 /TAXON_ID=67004 /ORGANISM="Thalassiosira weissflogii, Strain CCMP1336" /LENGTH=113 /DNA_ID=CAMNT_0011845671 /DNA_START=52 /DNA_END=393 /DNA_ORIENTATION=+
MATTTTTTTTSPTTLDQIKSALKHPEVIILDVRTKEELDEAPLASKPFKHASCHLDDCSELMSKAAELMPNKEAPIIVFCRSGRRAGKAKEMLEGMGYTKVLNAGGLGDIEGL